MSYYYYKVLGQANPAASTLTTLYTVPASTNAIISTITVCNQAASTATYSIAVRPFGATIDPKHYINYNAAIPASDTIGVTMGLTLAQTDVISVSSSNSSTSFNVFGTHITETVPVADQTTATSVQYLVVGGGGGGGFLLGGGGGAGGVVVSSAYTVTPGSVITVTVGAGGTAGTGGAGGTGVNSSIVGPTEYSLSLNGTSQYLTVPSNAALAFGTGDFTVECWLYVNVAPSGSPEIFTAGDFHLNFRTGSTIAITNNSTVLSNTAAISTGAWTHIAAVRSSGNMTIYINGVANTVATNAYSFVQGTGQIGSGNGASGPFMNVYMSNLRVLKGTALYTSGFTPSRAALTAITNTSLLTLQNSTFIDNSGNGIVLTAVSSAAMTNTLSPFNTGLGGGGGGTWQGGAGIAGASGGGGAGSDSSGGAGGGGTQSTNSSGGFGNAGGAGNGGRLGGGGGGAGSAGYAGGATALSAGTGGVGYQSIITTTSTYFAGGGGGGFESANAGNTYGRGGAGGGGNGGYSNSSYNGTAGSTNTGGGGGAGGNQSGSVSGSGAAGGSGTVIIRFSSANYYPATANTNATYTSTGGYNIYTFNSSGTLTI